MHSSNTVELKSGTFQRRATRTSIFHFVFAALMPWMQQMMLSMVTEDFLDAAAVARLGMKKMDAASLGLHCECIRFCCYGEDGSDLSIKCYTHRSSGKKFPAS